MFLAYYYNNNKNKVYGTRCKALYLLCKRLKPLTTKRVQRIVREAERMLEENYTNDIKIYSYVPNTDYCEINIKTINRIIKNTKVFCISDSRNIDLVLYNLMCVIKYNISYLPTLTSELTIRDVRNCLTLIDFMFIESTEDYIADYISYILQGKSKKYRKEISIVLKSLSDLKRLRYG